MERKPNLAEKIKLFSVRFSIFFLNAILDLVSLVLWNFNRIKNPKNILVYKNGNIGDIVCAIPSFIAIRKNYPGPKITFLTSPGKKGNVGARELLSGASYFDETIVYYAEDISSRERRSAFFKKLKAKKFDLFIQLPDDWATFPTMVRNMVFARILRVRAGYGFRIRGILNLFRKTQVDFTESESEVTGLLRLLRQYGIKSQEPEFDFDLTEEEKRKGENLWPANWNKEKELIVAIAPGASLDEKQWPIERFAKTALYLQENYGAKFVFLGGPGDISKIEEVRKVLDMDKTFLYAGKLNLRENFLVLQRSSFLIANDSGMMHIAAAAGVPVVALFTIRNILGRWFPYGQDHEILYHRFMDCNYRDPSCFKLSIEAITLKEVEEACKRLISKLNRN